MSCLLTYEPFLLILIIISCLALVEQFFYRLLGSFPYRYGIVVTTVAAPSWQDLSHYLSTKKPQKMSIHMIDNRKEIYIRYKYPFPTVGPILFIGQVEFCSPKKAKVRIGPLTALFIGYLLFAPILSGENHYYLNFIIILGIVIWFYLRYINSIKKLFFEISKDSLNEINTKINDTSQL